MNSVLVTEKTHDFFRGIEHLTKVGEETKPPAQAKNKHFKTPLHKIIYTKHLSIYHYRTYFKDSMCRDGLLWDHDSSGAQMEFTLRLSLSRTCDIKCYSIREVLNCKYFLSILPWPQPWTSPCHLFFGKQTHACHRKRCEPPHTWQNDGPSHWSVNEGRKLYSRLLCNKNISLFIIYCGHSLAF